MLLCSDSITKADLERYRHLYIEFKTAMVVAFPTKKFVGINWHIGKHWPFYIERFGVPNEYSTGRFEACHQKVKGFKKVSNYQTLNWDVARRVNELSAYSATFGPYNDFLAESTTALRTELQLAPITTNEPKLVVTPRGYYLKTSISQRELNLVELQKLRRLQLYVPAGATAKIYKTVILNPTTKLRAGQSAALQTNDIVYIEELLTVTCVGGLQFLAKVLHWTPRVLPQLRFRALQKSSNEEFVFVRIDTLIDFVSVISIDKHHYHNQHWIITKRAFK
eukprot:TRINITY_DN10752_c0_g1_i2.p1 TRINITY_DN10752_c0_g1~~TRINITY_DN10752_c0_g1_i2.p1  ORF type:complete len:279 (-),score=17.74 TRINITY_DN10752_c0_g1_i2:73-909(-)